MTPKPWLLALLLPGSLLLGCGEKDTDDSAVADDSGQTDDSDAPDDSGQTDDSSEPEGQPLDVTLLHVNDTHSHISEEDFGFDVSGLGLSVEVGEVDVRYGGYPRLIQLFAEREAAVTNPIKLHAGDALTGTLYHTLFGGEADADMMNRVCFDAFELGNHEFDGGDAGLASFLDHLASGSCGTPVLAANVSPGEDSPLASGYLLPYTVLTVEGQSVGLIGLDIAQKTMASSSPDDGTVLLDERTTAQQYIDELEGQGVDKIILVTHYTFEGDLALAASLSGVDVIVGGDSHSLLGGDGLSQAGFNVVGDYPTQVDNLDGQPVCVVQAWEYAHLMGELSVSFDAEGVVSACAGHPWLPFDGANFAHDEGTLSSADAALVTAALEALEGFVAVEADADALAALAVYDEQVGELENAIIGDVAEDLCLERFPGQGRSTICDVSETQAHGSDISNLVAKAFMTVSPTADIGIQNAGGVRVDLASGDFSIGDAYTLLPFSNTLVTLEMSGAQVVTMLEDALSNALDDGGSSGSYPYASGLRYDVDASQAEGSRVSNVEVNPRVAGTWQPINPSATYTVVTNNFIASGQDGYDTFGVVFDAGDYIDLYTEYAQGMVDYVNLLTTAGLDIERLPLEEYSTKSYVGRDGCDHSARSDCEGY
ncbi:MAG: 5'-nucleotidase C-terminal domain-containing protein [Alphaproteobacteria bacterium]|nr:5'-nucleotidase C-terminal domain-containing protein [Alphaproteobacteria bacterium]